MIDTYFDRADNMNRTNWLTAQREDVRRRITESDRYYNGVLYSTVLDRMVAEATENTRIRLDTSHRLHKIEIAKNIRLGDHRSWFKADGRRK